MAKTRYSKDMAWLEPFVEAVDNLVPTNRIMRIRGYRVRKGLEAATYGSKGTRGNRYIINLLSEEWSKSKKKFVRDTYEILLDTLAHELAHTVHFKHTPEHYRLKYKIGVAFSKVLERQSIRDHSKLWRKER